MPFTQLPLLAFPPLKIVTCSSTDCANDLHCFKKSRKAAERHLGARCYECGVDLIDWPRLHLRDVSDAQFTIKSLRNELIRHYYWHVPISARLVDNARRKGRVRMAIAIDKRIRSSVGDLPDNWDGRQTPLENSKDANVMNFGQHAVAACCRKCIETWHGIPKDRALAEVEVRYLSELVFLYVVERLPFLTERGERVPRNKVACHEPANSVARRAG